MVSTVNGLELGRVSLIGEQMEVILFLFIFLFFFFSFFPKVLLDTFVSPCNPVVDHNTRYSGLTEEALRGAPSLEEV